MTCKKAGRISFILMILGIIIAGIAMLIGESAFIFLYIGIGIAIIGLIVEFLFHRCPHCGTHVGTFIGTKCCRKCGRKL